ncbi:S8 family serine peptidase [Streptomyces sp. NPDC048473]|uniref:S8 family serine peptidase n=1 Tax=unclassified Streptomyces TaxID=2593676 RepID=UPI00371097A2
MTENSLLWRLSARGRYTGALALALAASVSAVPAAAAPTPTPSPSSSQSELRLPVVPSQLAFGADECTRASGTVMAAVPWAQRQLGLSRALRFTQGAGVTVGVVDTGIATKASGLSGRASAVGGAGQDCVGHGTFLAGIIAAAPREGAGFSGVAPATRIVAARGTDVTGVPSVALVAQGIRATVDGGAKVVEVSAALLKGNAALTSAVKYAADHDVLLIAPAVPDSTLPRAADGEARPPLSFWPAASDGVVSVLDIDIDGRRSDDAVTPKKADLSAPGAGVSGIGLAGKGHYIANGASVAAAFVAGTAALVRSYHPELSAQQVAQRLKSTSYPAEVPVLDVNGALTGILPAGPASPPRFSSEIHLTPERGDAGAIRRSVVLTGACVLLGVGIWGAMVLVRRSRTNQLAASRT